MNAAYNIEVVNGLAAEYEFEVEFIQPWHIRISLPGRKLDYFPKSGSATYVGSQKWFKIIDIQVFLDDIFHPTAENLHPGREVNEPGNI